MALIYKSGFKLRTFKMGVNVKTGGLSIKVDR
jgi:hypothetical protein